MDVMVTKVREREEWLLTDLLGRSMGVIKTAAAGGDLFVEPSGNARTTMTGMRCGPFCSLDEALAAIETHTRGVCRRDRIRPEPEEAKAANRDSDTTDASTDMPSKRSLRPE